MTTAVRRVLILNVGRPSDGEIVDRPEAYALRQARPDYVVFVCSRPGPSQGGSLDFVARYADLVGLPAERYELLELDDPDDLVATYQAVGERIETLRHRFPEAQLIADYTAGTKSMSAALVLAALDRSAASEIELRLVRGTRGQFATVIAGTEQYAPVSMLHDVRAARLVDLARAALERFDYDGAARALDSALQLALSSSLRQRLERARNLCRAFDAWDRYDLDQAEQLLALYRREWHEWLSILHTVREIGQAYEENDREAVKKVRDPYAIVVDLLSNAERCAARARYDDGVARIYRALELLIQLRLWVAHGIRTDAVPLDRIPSPLHERVASRSDENGTVQLGLLQAWDLLGSLPDEPLAEWVRENRGRLLDWSRVRNYSLLAHGLEPVTEASWQRTGRIGLELCRSALALLAERKERRPLNQPQFPTIELVK